MEKDQGSGNAAGAREKPQQVFGHIYVTFYRAVYRSAVWTVLEQQSIKQAISLTRP